MKILFLIILLINVAFAAWQFHTRNDDENIKYERRVDKGNLILLSEQKEREA